MWAVQDPVIRVRTTEMTKMIWKMSTRQALESLSSMQGVHLAPTRLTSRLSMTTGREMMQGVRIACRSWGGASSKLYTLHCIHAEYPKPLPHHLGHHKAIADENVYLPQGLGAGHDDIYPAKQHQDDPQYLQTRGVHGEVEQQRSPQRFE